MKLRAFYPATIPLGAATEANPVPPLPSSLQWMPPGEHEISASVDGQPRRAKVFCGPDDAARLDAQLQTLLAKAGQGEASRPFIDFDHEGKQAAALPVRFYWADGIRLQVEWTEAGAEALRGRTYSYFSPEFYLGKDGHPSALPDVGPIGALVNTPAFQTIERLAASNPEGAASTTPTPKHLPMEKTLAALVEAKLIPTTKLDDAEAASILTASFKRLTDDSAAAIKAAQDQVTALTAERDAFRKTEAEAAVAAKVTDEKQRTALVAAYLKDPESAKAFLAAMPAPQAKKPGAEPIPSVGASSAPALTGINRLAAALKRQTQN